MTNTARWAISLLASSALFGCGASSNDDSNTRTKSEDCDGGTCVSKPTKPSAGDDDASGGDGPVPCPSVASRRDVTNLDLLLAAPSAAPQPTTAPGGAAAPATPRCGDGHVTGTELCDDGNSTTGDGCDALCQVESGYACPYPGEPCVRTVICGDGVLDDAELCDDGNVTSGDGCTATCALEPGYQCPVAGAACTSLCGDYIVTGTEQCDDGNLTSGDGCNSQCRIEPGYVCPLQSLAQMMPADGSDAPPQDPAGPATSADPLPPCWPSPCGNGIVENGEACDDGNTASGDGCADCVLEPTCTADSCSTVCGDGIHVADAGEECDDGNLSPFDGCDEQCQIEDGFACMTTASALPSTKAPIEGTASARTECESVCGDGIAVADEACDDGDANGPDYGGCTSSCTLGPRCGDGVVDAGEQCDNGFNADRYQLDETSCAAGCILPPSCGDGIVQPTFGEQCDLGADQNDGVYGSCNPDCTLGPRCGDGSLQESEQCDDGNLINGDGCDWFCRPEAGVDQPPVVEPAPVPTVVPAPTSDVFVPDVPSPGTEPTSSAPNPCR